MRGRALYPLAAVFLGLALFLAAAEALTRVVSSRVALYDLEMWKYAQRVKIPGRDPRARFVHAPGVATRLMGVEVRTNAFGMRDREYPATPPPGTLRLAVLGDSITMGWGVPVERAYPRVLEGLLNQRRPLGAGTAFECLNFGVGNYGTRDEHALLLSRALSLRPAAVLVGYFLNDAEEAAPAAAPPLLGRSMFAVLLWGRTDALLRSLGARPDYEVYYRDLYRPERRGFREMREAMEAIGSACAAAGIPLVVAILPDLHAAEPYPFGDLHQQVRGIAEAAGAFVVDLADALPAGERSNFWVSRQDAHPNAEGHARYAAVIAERVPWARLLAPAGPAGAAGRCRP